MAKVMYVFDEPKTCSECPFIGKPEYVPEYVPDYDANDWLYRKIAECKLAPPELIEDPWMEMHWLCNSKPEWCPLRPVKED